MVKNIAKKKKSQKKWFPRRESNPALSRPWLFGIIMKGEYTNRCTTWDLLLLGPTTFNMYTSLSISEGVNPK